MNEEKKLLKILKILERFRNQLTGNENKFLDHLKSNSDINEKFSYHLFTDGAAEFDNNYKLINAGIGGLLKRGSKIIFTFAENIGSGRTNNEAEYLALIKGVKLCIEHNIYDIDIFSDSELIVNQVNGKYKIKDPKMIKLNKRVQKLISKLNSWNISHILRDNNIEADMLSKEGLYK